MSCGQAAVESSTCHSHESHLFAECTCGNRSPECPTKHASLAEVVALFCSRLSHVPFTSARFTFEGSVVALCFIVCLIGGSFEICGLDREHPVAIEGGYAVSPSQKVPSETRSMSCYHGIPSRLPFACCVFRFFSLLGLRGIYHYCKYDSFFPSGLKQM